MRALRPVVVSLFVLFPASAYAQSPLTDVRLAFFSAQRAFAQSVIGKTAQARLSALEAERAREIEVRNRTLEAQRQALTAASGLLDTAARSQRAKELEKFEVDLQRFIQDAQAEMMGAQRDVESAFLAKIRPALDQVAKERGLLLVINEDAGLVAWADPVLDITPEIVKRIDQP
jgi:outer membrane protein